MGETVARPQASGSASFILFGNLKTLYETGISAGSLWGHVGINGYHQFSLSAYPLAVSAWEAFFNETCACSLTRMHFPYSPLWLFSDLAERWSVEDKALVIPSLLFGQSLDPGAQPFQDFKRLVRIRNSITHYTPDDAPTKVLEHLAQRKLTLPAPDGSLLSWPLEIMSSEGVRWAINTVAAMVQTLTDMQPPETRSGTAMVFEAITEEQARDFYVKAGLDPDGQVLSIDHTV